MSSSNKKAVSPEIRKLADKFGIAVTWDEKAGEWTGLFSDLNIEVGAGTDREALAGVLDGIIGYLEESGDEEE